LIDQVLGRKKRSIYVIINKFKNLHWVDLIYIVDVDVFSINFIRVFLKTKLAWDKIN
jgi:hypothetical protein